MVNFDSMMQTFMLTNVEFWQERRPIDKIELKTGQEYQISTGMQQRNDVIITIDERKYIGYLK